MRKVPVSASIDASSIRSQIIEENYSRENKLSYAMEER